MAITSVRSNDHQSRYTRRDISLCRGQSYYDNTGNRDNHGIRALGDSKNTEHHQLHTLNQYENIKVGGYYPVNNCQISL